VRAGVRVSLGMCVCTPPPPLPQQQAALDLKQLTHKAICPLAPVVGRTTTVVAPPPTPTNALAHAHAHTGLWL
jgi:hypothetical protein